MWILSLVGYLGILVGFGFMTLAIASGLYYLAELVEEHTVIAKKTLTRLIYGVIGIQALLCVVDGFPLTLSAMSIVSHVVYLGNMRQFPVVKVTSPLFITSCALVALNHYFWFSHFSNLPVPETRSKYDSYDYPTFTQIASYFGICVWLIPFALFVSLSASDNVLPTMNSEQPRGSGHDDDGKKSTRQGMAKVVVDLIREAIGNSTRVLGYWLESRERRAF